MNYRKITQLVADKLSPAEAYTFMCLASKSDYATLESSVNQDTLTKVVDGITDVNDDRKFKNRIRTIQNHLYKFREEGLIDVTTEQHIGDQGAFKFNKYKLNDEHYSLIDIEILKLDGSKELKGFLILLKLRCLNGTNICKFSIRELADTLTISKSTVDRYIKEAESLGYIIRDMKKNIIKLTLDNIFYTTQESTIAIMKRLYPEALTDEDILTKNIN